MLFLTVLIINNYYYALDLYSCMYMYEVYYSKKKFLTCHDVHIYTESKLLTSGGNSNYGGKSPNLFHAANYYTIIIMIAADVATEET